MKLRRVWPWLVVAALSAVLVTGCDADSGRGDASSTGKSGSAKKSSTDGKGSGHTNPNPPPGLVKYDLPTRGSDLRDQAQWKRKLAARCTDAGEPPNCLSFRYKVIARVGGESKEIPNPGPNYRPEYSECLVYDLVPDPGEVEVGTAIVVKIRCFRSGSGSGTADTGDTDTSDTDTGDTDTGNTDTDNTDTGDTGTATQTPAHDN
jgi:hypothetical protein